MQRVPCNAVGCSCMQDSLVCRSRNPWIASRMAKFNGNLQLQASEGTSRNGHVRVLVTPAFCLHMLFA